MKNIKEKVQSFIKLVVLKLMGSKLANKVKKNKIIKYANDIRAYDDLIRMSTYYFIVSIASAALVIPYMSKQQGLTFTVSAIAIIITSGKLCGLLAVYFDDTSFKDLSKYMAIIETASALRNLLLFVDIELWVYVSVIVALVRSPIEVAWTFIYDDIISKGPEGTYRKIQTMESTLFGITGLIMGVVGIFLYSIHTYVALGGFIILEFYCTYLAWFIYNNIWKVQVYTKPEKEKSED